VALQCFSCNLNVGNCIGFFVVFFCIYSHQLVANSLIHKALLADGFVVHQLATEEPGQQQASNKKRKGLLGRASKLDLLSELEDDVDDFASLSAPFPNGPLLLEDVLAVLRPMVRTVACHLKQRLGTDFKQVGNNKWQKVIVTTTYSGMDFPGTALSMLRDYFAELDVQLDFQLYAATDIDQNCRKALLSKSNQPLHVFGSVLHRIPMDIRTSLQIELESHRFAILSQVDAGKAKGFSPEGIRTLRKKLIDERTIQFLRFAKLHLAKVDMARYKDNWCYSCQQVCSAYPPRQAGCLYIEIAGTTCVAFSKMSACQWGLLDDSAIPFFIWLYWVRHCQFDIVLHECVPSVPIELATAILQFGPESLMNSSSSRLTSAKLYGDYETVVNSPTDFGVPCCRKRRYTRWVLTDSVCGSPSSSESAIGSAIADDSHDSGLAGQAKAAHQLFSAETMQSFFYKKMVATSDVYMTASPEEIKEYYAKRFQANPHSVGSATEEAPDLLELLPPCARVHLEAARDMKNAAIMQGDRGPSVICLMQSPYQIRPNASQAFPTLLTGGLPFSLDHNRLILPQELLLAMGVLPVDQQSILRNLHERHVRRLVGNGMHISQIGAALLLVLAEAMLATRQSNSKCPDDGEQQRR